jgi:cytochrome c
LALGAAGVAAADEPLSDQQALHLLQKYNCQSCHSMDGGPGGPSYRAIASQYSSDPNAIDSLQIMVHNGSSGQFGDSVMPGFDVPDSDLRAMINWILQLQL